MTSKYAYALCEACRKKIARFNRAEAERRRKLKLPTGRPRKTVDQDVLARVRAGTLTLKDAAAKVGMSTVTLRRRLREQEDADGR
jgi:response regulator of citrate/malate metabolism